MATEVANKEVERTFTVIYVHAAAFSHLLRVIRGMLVDGATCDSWLRE